MSSTAQNLARVRVFVSGIVQGVGFRASTRMQAQKLGLAGWVRNRRDDRVEVVFEGDAQAVGKAVDWCRQGPSAATVKDLQIEDESPEGLTMFEVRPTV